MFPSTPLPLNGRFAARRPRSVQPGEKSGTGRLARHDMGLCVLSRWFPYRPYTCMRSGCLIPKEALLTPVESQRFLKMVNRNSPPFRICKLGSTQTQEPIGFRFGELNQRKMVETTGQFSGSMLVCRAGDIHGCKLCNYSSLDALTLLKGGIWFPNSEFGNHHHDIRLSGCSKA